MTILAAPLFAIPSILLVLVFLAFGFLRKEFLNSSSPIWAGVLLLGSMASVAACFGLSRAAKRRGPFFRFLLICSFYLCTLPGIATVYYATDRLWPGSFKLTDEAVPRAARDEFDGLMQKVRQDAACYLFLSSVQAHAAVLPLPLPPGSGRFQLGPGISFSYRNSLHDVYVEGGVEPHQRGFPSREGSCTLEISVLDRVLVVSSPVSFPANGYESFLQLATAQRPRDAMKELNDLVEQSRADYARAADAARSVLIQEARPSLTDFIYFASTVHLPGMQQVEIRAVTGWARFLPALHAVTFLALASLGLELWK